MSTGGNDASDMLAAALEQMDGIIAGTKLQFQNGLNSAEPRNIPSADVQILKLLEDVKDALDNADTDHNASTRNQVPVTTSQSIVAWLKGEDSLQTNGNSCQCHHHDNDEEKLQRLEDDKSSLMLQVSVLTDQVEAQTDNIRELNTIIEQTLLKVDKTEEMLQQEIGERTSLQNEKLNLVDTVSELKIKLARSERDQLEPDDRLREYMNELAEYKTQVREKDEEIECLRREIDTLRKVKEATTNLEKDTEVGKLKEAVESLMVANGEKDRKIDELKRSLNRYRRVQDMVMNAQGKKENGMECAQSDSTSTLNSQPSTVDLEESNRDKEIETSIPIKQSMPFPTATSTPVNSQQINLVPTRMMQEGASPVSVIHNDTVIHVTKATENNTTVTVVADVEKTPQMPTHKSSSLEDIRDMPDTAKTPAYPDYSTLPNSPRKPKDVPYSIEVEQQQLQHQQQQQQQQASNGIDRLQEPPPQHVEENNLGKASASYGRGVFKVKGGKRSNSAPNLAETEVVGMEEEIEEERGSKGSLQRYGGMATLDKAGGTGKEQKKKKSGFKRFFGRLRRSSSGSLNLEEEDDNGFNRGGRLRSTAGARLGWSKDLKNHNDIDVPFANWDSDKVAAWLHEMGLGQYVSACKQCVRNGSTLIKATPHFLEKDLGIKHPLHRKKLQLALRATASEEPDKMGELDYNWVTRWLDDVGLPQYKDSFNESRVDGRMLHYMTVDDLYFLKVTNILHQSSLKRGIQCLRIQNFHPNCLKRRPTDESWQNGAEVMVWTSHRVMEWLRSVDLSEYVPNLRGSGVHGALLVLEPSFTAETLATLLSIPPNKTLLRRHLTTHFVALVGADCQAKKRELELLPGHIPLSQLAKVKPKKKTPSLARKKKSGCEPEDYLCPMNIEMPTVPRTQPRNQHTNGSLHTYKQDIRSANMVHRQNGEEDGEVELNEGAVLQIGAFSEDINKLTNMLAEDMFDEAITSTV
ncbi:liprin-beta-1-like [Saccoglossus kowalevskii]